MTLAPGQVTVDQEAWVIPVPVAVHPGIGLIHGCFDMLGVTAAARDEMDRVLRSVREALAVTSIEISRSPTRGLAGDPGPSGQ